MTPPITTDARGEISAAARGMDVIPGTVSQTHEQEGDRMPYFPASQRYALPYRAIAMRRERDMLLQAAEAAASLRSPTVLATSRPDRRVNGGPAASNLKLVADEDGFGAQRGDPGRGVDIDLSTCVNRYGPAPAAIAALRSISPGRGITPPLRRR
jgi:hypothetical protein